MEKRASRGGASVEARRSILRRGGAEALHSKSARTAAARLPLDDRFDHITFIDGIEASGLQLLRSRDLAGLFGW